MLEQSLTLAPHWALELAVQEEAEQEAAAQKCQLEVSPAPTTQSTTNISRRYKIKVNLHAHSSQCIKTQVPNRLRQMVLKTVTSRAEQRYYYTNYKV